ncbi:type VI secretion system tip protein TssI/VgrG [Pseudomonas sp. DC1.2]|uniref:type VI secretion system tip protein TssI/VgrG n=1 Tax=Pseudomonas sp. DC1.2 TaxID=3048622 RepID=UPI002AC894F2|nr:type VI secretion system tip protein TssI/VgrG [Pseudomonas sp. DC1.2]MEB0099580.1 type VI secretion system tip protein TssI/VgrG [Pseudomonas sp. DC1.2]WPX60865.1 type VI secretion system tip protein TssI/VgrG [Pseudomonas sp. DC1.2]
MSCLSGGSSNEGLNRPYRFDIEVISLAPTIGLDRLLRQSAFLSLGNGQCIHGLVYSAGREHRGPHRIHYNLVLVPYLQILEQQRSRRVFHRQSVPAILRQLLEEHRLPEHSYRFELNTGHYPARPFCIQYEETDLALVQRLCEEEGIHYHFEHHEDRHVLVLADDSLSFPQEPVLISFHGEVSCAPVLPAISELFQRYDSPTAPAYQEAKDRGEQTASQGAANHTLAGSHRLQNRCASEQRHGDQLSRRTLQRLRCLHPQICGKSDQPRFLSGHIVQVDKHPVPCFNDQWLLIDIRHQGHHPSTLDDRRPAAPQGYRNQFTATAWSTVFRPPLKQLRPCIPGYQPARVLGPAGQSAPVDDHGRIQVSLWPNAGSGVEASHGIWLPVVISTANGRAETTRLPMAGSDVLVSFLDSDPDRPVLCIDTPPASTPQVDRHERRSDTRLLLDWLINRPDLKP